jgi:hypothetical protein
MFIAAFLFLWGIVKLRQTDRKKELLVEWGKNVLWVMGFITVLWPSSLFTLGLMRSYALQIYMTLFRLPADTTRYSSLLEMLYNKWNASPLELLIAVLLLGVLLRYWRLMFRYGSFFVASCFLLVLICFHFTMRVTLWWYLFPFFAILFSFYIPALFRLRVFSPRWQKSLPVAAGVAVLFWGSALWMVHIPRSEQTFRIHDIVRSTPSNHILVPLSIYTQIKGYFPSKKLVRYHDTKYDTEFLDDSVHVWRRQGMVIVPKQFATKIRQQFDDSTESYLVFESVQ